MALILGDNGNNPNLNGGAADDIIIGFAGNDTLRGFGGNDNLDGGDDNDRLDGGDGDDILDGGRGNDTLDGGADNDVMQGGAGNDRLIWNNGDGSDFMNGGTDTDVVEVNGSTSILGDVFVLSRNNATTSASDVIFQRTNFGQFSLTVDEVERFEVNGLNGSDRFTVNNLSGTNVNRVIFNGGEGNDTLNGSLATTRLIGNGGTGNDSLTGGSNHDTLSGNQGDDTLDGGAGSDRLIWTVGDGNDSINGGAGNDQVEINGSSLGDTFRLNQDASGDAIVRHIRPLNPFPLLLATVTADEVEQFNFEARDGSDRLEIGDLSNTDVTLVRFDGGDGNDTLDGSDTSTRLYGVGAEGNDQLFGGSGNDRFSGGTGNDTLRGGAGNDTLIGGAGNDRFEFTAGPGAAFNPTSTVAGFPVDPNLGVDVITDFDPNALNNPNDSFDRIILDNDIFTALLTPAGNALAASEFAIVDFDALAADSDARIVYSRGTGRLFYNQNSDDNQIPPTFGTGGLFAVLDANLNLSNQDFFVVG